MTRKFSSYGPIDPDLHYHAPRQALIDQAYLQLVGENPAKGGHYITVWAPRQRGKTWLFQQAMQRIIATGEFEVGILTLQGLLDVTKTEAILAGFVRLLRDWFKRDFPVIKEWSELTQLFTADYFSKPLILILDEFDTLTNEAIGHFVSQLRTIYLMRNNEVDKVSGEKGILLHGIALIGVRASLGIDNKKGSPFNVQRGLHVPNLTLEELLGMLCWYEQDSGQTFEEGVKERLFYETQGQPGLVSWLAELLTETYNKHNPTITMTDFDRMYNLALHALPNNNILNIISKAKQEPYTEVVLKLFEAGEKKQFAFDNVLLNYLYLNGVVDYEDTADEGLLVKFPSPFVQKRLFNYFSYQLFNDLDRLYPPFEDLSDTITETELFIKPMLGRYERYLRANRSWLLKDAPRRSKDLRIFEAVYHFNLYMYLSRFLQPYEAYIIPEFPTGNGKIDLLIKHAGQRYGLELKSFSTAPAYKKALKQAAAYAKELKLPEITLVFFVEAIDEANRLKYEVMYLDSVTQLKVWPVFVEFGE